DLVQLDGAGHPIFWGECGEVGLEKLRVLCGRYRDTHLIFSKWAINLQPFAGLIEQAMRGVRRSAPIELIGFDADATRFVDPNGEVRIDFADVDLRTFG
ncbi:MAG TPA: hypothetical protein VFX76_06760, partial [Roseiflexaceae bacterium]|nr:hypothetical protein [Roseiflexaceae bacterium]